MEMGVDQTDLLWSCLNAYGYQIIILYTWD